MKFRTLHSIRRHRFIYLLLMSLKKKIKCNSFLGNVILRARAKKTREAAETVLLFCRQCYYILFLCFM